MPLSRQQMIEVNDRRLKAIKDELTDIAMGQASSTDADEQKTFLTRKDALEAEKRALDNACEVLQREIEDGKREKEAQDAKHWKTEKVTYESEFEEICDKIETRLVNTKALYDKLIEAENRAKEQWKKRGMPGTPARTQSRRTFSNFLGVTSTRPIGTSTGRRKRLAKLFSSHNGGK